MTCSGFSGVSANFFPWVISWLCGSKEAPVDKREKVQEFLSVGDRVIAHKVGRPYTLTQSYKINAQ